jgi:AmmeMemoRadiSam system protein B
MFEPGVRRAPAVAGRFYAGDPDKLRQQLDVCMPEPADDPRAQVCIGPHAGWVYSGRIYGETLAQVEVPRRVIAIGPNHTGRGVPVSLWSGGSWEFPGFEVAIDRKMVDSLHQSGLFEPDLSAHRDDHCLEVQVPFMARRQPELRLTPIILSRASLDLCQQLGVLLAQAVRSSDERVLLAISTDMSHFHPADEARALDELCLERVLAMDPEGLYSLVRARGISMCGFIPTTVALYYAHARGLSECRLVRYGHSGEVSGDDSRVVGYAGLVIS